MAQIFWNDLRSQGQTSLLDRWLTGNFLTNHHSTLAAYDAMEAVCRRLEEKYAGSTKR